MKSIVYPLQVHRRFEQRWQAMAATKMAALRASRAEGTDKCKCGYIVTAPTASTHWPLLVVNEWHCPRCGEYWETEMAFDEKFKR